MTDSVSLPTTPPAGPPKNGRTPAVGFIFITLLLDVIGLGIIIPVIPKLIQELTGEGLSKAAEYGGWLLFSYAICQFLFSPVVGGLSDRYGRRPVLLGSLLGFGLDYFLLALAPTLSWLFVGRILSGILGASFTTGAVIVCVERPIDLGSHQGSGFERFDVQCASKEGFGTIAGGGFQHFNIQS